MRGRQRGAAPERRRGGMAGEEGAETDKGRGDSAGSRAEGRILLRGAAEEAVGARDLSS